MTRSIEPICVSSAPKTAVRYGVATGAVLPQLLLGEVPVWEVGLPFGDDIGEAAVIARSGPGWVHEIKHEGYRMMVRRDGQRSPFLSPPQNWLT